MKEILKSIYPYLFLAFCFVLPLDKYAIAIPNIMLISLAVTFPFVVKKADFNKLLSKEIILFGVLIIYILINSSLFQDIKRDISIISKIISSLALIVLYIPIEKTEKLKKTIIASVFVGIMISLYNLYFFYMDHGEFNFATGAIIDDVLIVDRLYIGFLCVISIIMCIDLIGDKYKPNNKWYFASIVLSVLFVLLISSRSAILLLLMVFFLKIVYAKKKKVYILFFLGVSIITIIAFSFNDNLKERFFYTNTTHTQKSYLEKFEQWEPRVVIWECNFRVLKNEKALINGIGYYNTQDKLTDCYGEIIKDPTKKIYFQRERFNTHNQFLDFLLSSGVLAFLLFTSIFCFLFYRNLRSFSSMALLLSIVLFALVESLLHRQFGAYYFGIILILLLFDSKQNRSRKH